MLNFMAFIGPKAEKKRYQQIWEATVGANFPAFISNLGPICNPKMLKVGPKIFSP
jgi:hypothetical protein